MVIADADLYQILFDNQYLDKEKLDRAQHTAVSSGTTLQEALLRHDFITDHNLGVLVADHLNLPYISLTRVAIPEDLTVLIPEEIARLHRTVAFGWGTNSIHIATANPTNQQFLTFLAKKAGQPINIYYATDREIERALSIYKKHIQSAFDEMLNQQVAEAKQARAGEAPIIKMVDTLIEYAADSRASDIHLEPTEENSLVRFRVDGILHDTLRLPKNLHEQLVARIKVLSHLRTDEHLSAQDGRFTAKLENEALDIRTSIAPIMDGEKVVLRLLTSRHRQFGLNDLGLSEDDMKKVVQATQRPYGMILATGPTGCGKTTTMYAVLKLLNTRERNIATIEDPVEYEIEGINQIQVNPKTNLTFASGLRSILRQDPDIMYVGEIRDEETADIAINSALTGHLVLSTLHTNNAITSLPRLIDMGVEPFLIASTVQLVVAQRLVRKICDRCRVSYTVDCNTLYRLFGENSICERFGEEQLVRLYRGKGCPACHGVGYLGRIGIFEVMEMTPELHTLVVQKADAETLLATAQKQGMHSILDDGLAKVESGATTIEEVLRITSE